MKKVLAFLMMVCIVLGISACNNDTGTYHEDRESELTSVTSQTPNNSSMTSSTTVSNNSSTYSSQYDYNEVTYISDREVDYYSADKKHTLFFGFKNAGYTLISASGTASISIYDNDNNKLFSKEVKFGQSNFSTWSNKFWSESKYLCSIDIKDSELKHSNTSYGILKLKVTLSNGLYFDEVNLNVYDLPQHEWQEATCTSAKKCKSCGKTSGSAKGHSYSSYDNKCYNCGKLNPEVQNVIKKCSLQLPSLPQTVHYKSSSGTIYSSVKVTKITYEFEYYGDGKVILTCKFSGEKIYDYRGSGQSDDCKISWKLYAPDGSVFRAGTFSSPSISVGESFSNQEEDLIYNFEASDPGAYKLVILNTN